MKLSALKEEDISSLSVQRKTDFLFAPVRDGGESADVALLLGGGPETHDRVQAAVKLYKAGRVKYIVPTGSPDVDYEGEKIPEAEAMKKWLIKEGVKEEHIFPEPQAKNTAENMMFGAITILRNIPFKPFKLFVVTSQAHLLRSLQFAKLCLPSIATVYGYASENPREGRDQWFKDEWFSARVDAEIKLIKLGVDYGFFPDMEI